MIRPETRTPVVTVVTPVFNMADRIEACLASVGVAARGDVEHIVVDGGSTDGTVDVLRRHPEIRWISEPDGGQSDAINKGFAMASGRVIGWLNADDELLPGSIDAVLLAFEDPGVGWVYGDMVVNDGTREWVERSPRHLTWASMCRGNVVGQPGSFYARWALDQVGPLDETFHYTMDFELFLRFIKSGIRAEHLCREVARFHLHGGSKSGSIPPQTFAEDEARALLKHGDAHAAGLALDRSYWHDTIVTIDQLVRAGDYVGARQVARDRRVRLQPVLSRVRGFVWLTSLVPRAVPWVWRFRRTQRS